MDSNWLLVRNWNDYKVWVNISTLQARVDFHFLHRRGGKIWGGVQVICNMLFLLPWEEQAWNIKPKSARGVKWHCSGVNTFWKGFKKSLGGLTPPPSQENPPMVHYCWICSCKHCPMRQKNRFYTIRKYVCYNWYWLFTNKAKMDLIPIPVLIIHQLVLEWEVS